MRVKKDVKEVILFEVKINSLFQYQKKCIFAMLLYQKKCN
jgi:hypothetical protein